jgi:hypothetical protein
VKQNGYNDKLHKIEDNLPCIFDPDYDNYDYDYDYDDDDDDDDYDYDYDDEYHDYDSLYEWNNANRTGRGWD